MGAHQKRGYRALRLSLVLAALAFLVWAVQARWSDISRLQIDARWIAVASLALGAALWGQVAAWRWNLKRLGARVAFTPLFRVYYATNLARYIPGKVWSLAGMVAGGMRLGIEPARMSASVFLGLVSSLFSGLCVGSLAAFVLGQGRIFSTAFLLMPLLALALMWPPVYRRWAGWLLRRLRQDAVIPAITGHLLWRSVCHYGLVWCAYGAAAGATGLALQPGSFGLFFAVFPLAYLAGYAALFAPGGWGVREGAIVILAGGGAVALGVSLLLRLLLTLFECVLFGYAIWSWRHD